MGSIGAPGPPLSKFDAHPFVPAGGAGGDATCAVCGESRNQIRHHPTRIAAACLLKGLDPASVLRSDPD